MGKTTTTDSLEILGSADEKQLVVRANSSQSEVLQEWQASDNSELAQLTEDGRFRVGGDLDIAAPSALVEANKNVDPHTGGTIRQGIQSRGIVDGDTTQIDEPLQWNVQELEIEGSGGITSVHAALRAQVTNNNTGSASGAELRAGDFLAVNNEDNSLGKASAVAATVVNASGATIDEAAVIEVIAPDNDGTITTLYGLLIPDIDEGTTSNYAIYTEAGIVAFGDQVGIGTDTPDSSAVLEVASSNQGVLLPRVSGTGSISSPVDGLVIYDTTSNKFKGYANGSWVDLH